MGYKEEVRNKEALIAAPNRINRALKGTVMLAAVRSTSSDLQIKTLIKKNERNIIDVIYTLSKRHYVSHGSQERSNSSGDRLPSLSQWRSRRGRGLSPRPGDSVMN